MLREKPRVPFASQSERIDLCERSPLAFRSRAQCNNPGVNLGAPFGPCNLRSARRGRCWSLEQLFPHFGCRGRATGPCDPQRSLRAAAVKPRVSLPHIFGDTFSRYKIAILGSGEFRHSDRHCVAPFVAEREEKEPVYQRLLRNKRNWLVLERVKGIEPSYSAWKAAALPLSYTRARAIN